jgi:hypothetical protein
MTEKRLRCSDFRETPTQINRENISDNRELFLSIREFLVRATSLTPAYVDRILKGANHPICRSSLQPSSNSPST